MVSKRFPTKYPGLLEYLKNISLDRVPRAKISIHKIGSANSLGSGMQLFNTKQFVVRFLCSLYAKNINAMDLGATLCEDNQRILSSDKNNICLKENSSNYAKYAACLGIKENAYTDKGNLSVEDLPRETVIKRKFLKREPERKSKLGLRMMRF